MMEFGATHPLTPSAAIKAKVAGGPLKRTLHTILSWKTAPSAFPRFPTIPIFQPPSPRRSLKLDWRAAEVVVPGVGQSVGSFRALHHTRCGCAPFTRSLVLATTQKPSIAAI